MLSSDGIISISLFFIFKGKKCLCGAQTTDTIVSQKKARVGTGQYFEWKETSTN
jgi:hypothetical protein